MKHTQLLREIYYDLKTELSEHFIEREKLKEYIDAFCLNSKKTEHLQLEEIADISQRITMSMTKEASILEKYLEMDGITEIMVNGADEIFIERDGEILKTDESFIDEKELADVIRRIGNRVNREINENNPILDARLPDGSRVNAVYKNLTGKSSILTIRRFNKKNITIDELVENKTINEEGLRFIEGEMKKGKNIFVSGGTSSGKTTMLNALISFISKKERVIVIEDSREISVHGVDNVVQLECKLKSSWNEGEIGIDSLIKSSLRMRPDRIIIGEIRDGKAMINMLNGLNTGHKGMSTGHANSLKGMIRRMESFYMQEASFPVESIDEQIAQAIDIFIHMERKMDGSRKVVEIAKVYMNEKNRIGIDTIFAYDEESGELIGRGESR